MSTRRREPPGPFRARDLAPRSEYELGNGHPVRSLPTGGRGAATILDGGSVLRSDPKARRVGVDAGFSPDEGTLRAPDLSIVPEDPQPGWIPGVPPLAVEYADRGQDEDTLQEKIADLLARGTSQIWVVRLVGVRRVEVYRPGEPVRVVGTGEYLHAPEQLANPVLVDSLWDPNEADKATLRNLLERFGYPDLDALREEGRQEGLREAREQRRQEGREEGSLASLREAVRLVLAARGLSLGSAEEARIAAADAATLKRLLTRAATVGAVSDLFEE